VTDRTLVGAQEPALEEAGDPLDPRHKFVGLLPPPCEDRHLAPVAELLDATVALPAVCMDDTSGIDRAKDERVEVARRRVRDESKANPSDSLAVDLGGHCDQGLSLRFPAADAPLEAPEARLGDFDNPFESASPRSYHRPTEFVQPRPGRHVAPNTQDPLEAQGAHHVVVAGHVPDCPEPQTERLLRVPATRSGADRRLVVAPSARDECTRDQTRVVVAAPRATEAIGPAKVDKIVPARGVGREARLELQEILWVVLRGRGTYQLAQAESTKYTFLLHLRPRSD